LIKTLLPIFTTQKLVDFDLPASFYNRRLFLKIDCCKIILITFTSRIRSPDFVQITPSMAKKKPPIDWAGARSRELPQTMAGKILFLYQSAFRGGAHGRLR
jgi:hypothetical protein